ncbi:hypothetical protein SAMN05660831_00147 [Thiohalospira halophila DSM 15071]|uniref:Tetratricopeptide repeat-containing protein n=1 Tax=Thiohalospira halophila DSM 15071 TaxID=1123397 RepID=A0A1I1N7B5_9GAMM|nr:tetratricopeptide repeat protein [Thiohalospira halophila]SFC93604.1 hypothetical protein SAMN05660831_00147 [Thiohalospira halophila DSM 15071]
MRVAVTLLLALSTAVVQAGPDWRQRSDGEQAAQRTLNQAQRLAPQQPQRALELLHEGLEAHPGHVGLRLAAARLEQRAGRPGAARRLLRAGTHTEMAPHAARRYARALAALEAPEAARRLLRRRLAALPRWPAAAVAALRRRGPEELARRLSRDYWQRQRLTSDLRRLTANEHPVPETP